MTALRIFAVYDAKDAEFVTQLITDLHNAGVEVITNNIGLEDTAFEQILNEELLQCQYLIVIQTPEALQSPRVRAIVDSALKQVQADQMTRVLRVIAPALDGAGTQAVPLRWATTPEFDASQDYQKALTRLCLHLGIGTNEVHQDAPPPPASPLPPPGLPDLQETGNKSPGPLYVQRSAAEDRPLRPMRYPHRRLRQQLFFLSLAMVLVLIVTSGIVFFIHQSSASIAANGTPVVTSTVTGSTPATTQTSTSPTNLDDQPDKWALYADQAGETLTNVQSLTDVSSPSIDGNALKASFTGQGMLVYRALPPADNTTTFELDLSFYLSAVTPIPALPFAMGKLANGQWWEWGLQWLNNPNGATWRVWNGENSSWQDTQVTQNLASNVWHSFQLKGNIVNGQVHYISFSCDQVSQNLNQTFAPVSRSSNDQLAVFSELDGDQANAYQVYMDEVNLKWN